MAVRVLTNLLLGAALVLFLAVSVQALDVPPYTTRVNDLANMMSPATRQALEARLADLEATDSTQVAVLTVPSLGGESLEGYSIRVADAWKVGQKGFDNGVILLVSKQDRGIRIEVGLGLEGTLTDVLAGQIIDNIITPLFKAGKFDQGFTDGVAAISGAVRGEFKAVDKKPRSKINLLAILIGPMIFFILITERFGRRLTDSTTGSSRLARRMGPGMLFLPGMLGHRTDRHDGFGGGGFGGGGFGGFGGGGFGGGGASGGW